MQEVWQRYFGLTCLLSLAWMGATLWLATQWAVALGCTLHTPQSVIGAVVLTTGLCIPNAVSALSVARDGGAASVVVNVVGTNIFNLCCGLGIPWLVVLRVSQS